MSRLEDKLTVAVIGPDGDHKLYHFDTLLEQSAFAHGYVECLRNTGADADVDGFPCEPGTIRERIKTKMN